MGMDVRKSSGNPCVSSGSVDVKLETSEKQTVSRSSCLNGDVGVECVAFECSDRYNGKAYVTNKSLYIYRAYVRDR